MANKKKVFTDESLATLVNETKQYVDNAVSGKANVSHTHSISEITIGTLPISNGGTGATTAEAARTNLDVYSKSEINSISQKKITYGTSDPSGGSNGDIYIKYS